MNEAVDEGGMCDIRHRTHKTIGASVCMFWRANGAHARPRKTLPSLAHIAFDMSVTAMDFKQGMRNGRGMAPMRAIHAAVHPEPISEDGCQAKAKSGWAPAIAPAVGPADTDDPPSCTVCNSISFPSPREAQNTI